MGVLRRLLGRGHERRGEGVAARLDALAQIEPHYSSEALRRRLRDIFFAVMRSWIERDPGVAGGFLTAQMTARQRLRIEGLVRQRRVHQLENPLIEDLDFVGLEESPEERVVARLELSLVETILDADTGALVAGAGRVSHRRVEYWTLLREGGDWRLADVERADEGGRHLAAPLVGEEYVQLSPELLLRERYAREEITLDEFERELARMLEEGPTY